MQCDSENMQKPRKGKEREAVVRRPCPAEPRPTDIVERITAMRRRNAGPIGVKDRAERTQSPQQLAPQVSQQSPSHSPKASSRLPTSPRRAPPAATSRHAHNADHEDFSRRLKISPSLAPPSTAGQAKLFNPNTDPIPMRRTAEPASSSDPPTTVFPSRNAQADRSRQLFDHRKDDPMRFTVLARPTAGVRPTPAHKSSGEYVSASSTSSYAASISSTFTLSTDESSTSSALFDGRPAGTDDSGSNVFSAQLKRLYRVITNLEAKIKQEDQVDDAEELGSRVVLKGNEIDLEELEKDKWRRHIGNHKKLAEIMHNLLEISLAPSVPASLRNIPTKYNIIVRLWTYAFHKLLEALRRASFASPLALEHLQDFIYYAYTFYTGLLEEPTLATFKAGWLEALGDLARYRMAVADMVSSRITAQSKLTAQAVSQASNMEAGEKAALLDVSATTKPKSVSDAPAARIDDSPSPSVGVAAARLLDVEPEKERWREIARDWYGLGLAEQPGTGKLHHHIGLLSREVEGEDLRGVYHFAKSMAALHPFPTSRESILPIWSPSAQQKRAQPDVRASSLFVLFHGMLFTNIQLDDFTPTLARFVERLEIEGAEEREWIMMGIINVAAILEYGRPNGVLRRIGVCTREGSVQQQAAMRVMAKKVAAGVPTHGWDEKMDVDEPLPSITETIPADEGPVHPAAFTYALQLTFSILSLGLRNPTYKASSFARTTINPYVTVILTFLTTVLRHPMAVGVLERSIPWDDLATFFCTVPRVIMNAEGLLTLTEKAQDKAKEVRGERWAMLTSGCAPPLNEDWCMRGMEWVGRRVFERGYWKSGGERCVELEVLKEGDGGEVTDGHIEDDDNNESPRELGVLGRQWMRVVRCGVTLASIIDGFTWREGTREWRVDGKLKEKVEMWKEDEIREREEEEKRRMGRRWVEDSMDVDDETGDSLSEDSEDDEADSEEVKALKARRRYLKSLVQAAQAPVPPAQPKQRLRKKETRTRPSLQIIPGYTVLVVDTNILLSTLSVFSSLVDSLKWTVIVPLPVIMELDGLSSNSSAQLAEAAQDAIAYITTHIRSHALSLKVQTSKGNYLSTLTFRTEQIDFSSDDNMERNMDDLILKAAIWQDEHWVDRSAMLKAEGDGSPTAVKVVLLSLDRNLRLKSRSRQLPAATESDLAAILAAGT